MYHWIFRTFFVRLDPELAHHLGMTAIRAAAAIPPARRLVENTMGKRGPAIPAAAEGGPLPRAVPGVLGLAAGMDKDAEAIIGMDMLGFGFVEVGTVTPRPQGGNEKPRLWRLVERRGLRNRMGFNNRGSAEAARRLQRLRTTERGRQVVVGVNIGKNKTTALEDAVSDYVLAATDVARWCDYLVVNVSSPNTPGLRDLQAVESLEPILQATGEAADQAAGRSVPLFVKIAPDLSEEDLKAVAEMVNRLDLTGVVATNTTIDHDLGPGGMSGDPLTARALEVVRLLRTQLDDKRILMGVGGISTVADAQAMLAAGADLLQGFTAFIYDGPAWAGRINRALGAPLRSRA